MIGVPIDPDPVLAQRARASRLADLGQRVGYLLYAIAIVVFLVGLLTSFTGAVSAIVIGAIIGGSVVLAPAIIAGYAVKAESQVIHGPARVVLGAADARWLQANAGQDPVLRQGDAVVIHPMPETVTVIAADGNRCTVRHRSALWAGNYAAACERQAKARDGRTPAMAWVA